MTATATKTRTYQVIVVGRMSENATYYVQAANKPEAKKAARRLALDDYASGAPRDFRWSSHVNVASCERTA